MRREEKPTRRHWMVYCTYNMLNMFRAILGPSSRARDYMCVITAYDRLCGLVVRVSGYRYRGLGFDSRRYQIFWVVVRLERGPHSLVRSIEELLE